MMAMRLFTKMEWDKQLQRMGYAKTKFSEPEFEYWEAPDGTFVTVKLQPKGGLYPDCWLNDYGDPYWKGGD